MADENAENATRNADHEMDEASDQENYSRKRTNGKSQKQSRQKLNLKTPPAKSAKRKGAASPTPVALNVMKKPWPVKEDIYEEEDSEETEEDQENVEGWRYAENNEEDDEETEYED
ncbi:zinc finger transcription factor YY1-like [Syzygium oleosum]|uniref:zinc finger transcription factor YY1-like n=1 Tax=Syzygium oleosum TaxID=219896 RepID=UPI0024BBD895|nr:zinc finger transcription factor YY1-like [Syzygium oleosum]